MKHVTESIVYCKPLLFPVFLAVFEIHVEKMMSFEANYKLTHFLASS